MTDNLDKYLDTKLKSSNLAKTSPDFTRFLMQRIRSDFAIDTELRKTDRTANLIMGFFASLIGIIFIASGYFYFASKTPETSQLESLLHSTGSASSGYYETFSTFMHNLSLSISGIIPSSPKYVGFIITLLVLTSLYLLADKVILGHKFKSRRV